MVAPWIAANLSQHYFVRLIVVRSANQKASELQAELNPPDAEDCDMWFPIELTYDIPGLPLPYRR